MRWPHFGLRVRLLTIDFRFDSPEEPAPEPEVHPVGFTQTHVLEEEP